MAILKRWNSESFRMTYGYLRRSESLFSSIVFTGNITLGKGGSVNLVNFRNLLRLVGCLFFYLSLKKSFGTSPASFFHGMFQLGRNCYLTLSPLYQLSLFLLPLLQCSLSLGGGNREVCLKLSIVPLSHSNSHFFWGTLLIVMSFCGHYICKREFFSHNRLQLTAVIYRHMQESLEASLRDIFHWFKKTMTVICSPVLTNDCSNQRLLY